MTIHTAIPSPIGTMTVDEFLLFLEGRPEEEHWDLVEGVATMMAPASYAHQWIVFRLQSLLNAHFQNTDAELRAYQDVGVRVAALDNFMPRPDVAVVPGIPGDEYYSIAFRFVAEILSPSNTPRLIERKIKRYRDNAECHHILIIDSRRVWAELHSRGEAWTVSRLEDSNAEIALPAFGFACRLGDLYRGTTLDSERR
jgi:Uma2 family endonuclease